MPDKQPAADDARDQKPNAEPQTAGDIDKDDPKKVEKLAKLGHAGDEAAEGSE